MEILVQSGKKMSELAAVMDTFPQVMINVSMKPCHRGLWKQDQQVQDKIQAYTEQLGENGRILVRESGTEPLIRVMVEGKDATAIQTAAEQIAAQIQEFVNRA